MEESRFWVREEKILGWVLVSPWYNLVLVNILGGMLSIVTVMVTNQVKFYSPHAGSWSNW